jgi:hypothetical protein
MIKYRQLFSKDFFTPTLGVGGGAVKWWAEDVNG